MNDVNILILGNSLCGKSTLSAYLCCEEGASFLDDDSIYYYNKRCYGFHFPIALRNNIIDFSKWYIGDTYDATHTKRMLVGYERTIETFPKIDLILFPQYNTINTFSNQITNGSLFKELINFIRTSTNMKSLVNDINWVVQNCIAYQISYTSCYAAMNLINAILKTL